MMLCHWVALCVVACRMNTDGRTDGRTGRQTERVQKKKFCCFRNITWRNYICSILKTFILADWTARRFSVLQIRPDRLCGPPGLLLSRYLGSFPGVKRSRREVAQWPSSSAEVKTEWSCSSAPSIRLHGVDRSNFNFLSLVTHFCPFLHKVRLDVSRHHEPAWRVDL